MDPHSQYQPKNVDSEPLCTLYCKTTPAKKIITFQPGSKKSASDFFSNCKKKKTVAESPAIKKKENLIGKKKRQKGQICKIEEYGVTACIILP